MDILPAHLELIKKILKAHLPAACTIYAFGSRVTGGARKYSDLDLAIDNQGIALSLEQHARLEESFQESHLPYKVDFLDWNAISDQFKQHIDRVKVVLDVEQNNLYVAKY